MVYGQFFQKIFNFLVKILIFEIHFSQIFSKLRTFLNVVTTDRADGEPEPWNS